MRGLYTKNIDCKLSVVENFLNDDSYKNYFESIGYYLSDIVDCNQIYIKK